MSTREEALFELIRDAFYDVALDDGVSLHEARACCAQDAKEALDVYRRQFSA
jgi:hypothetical protein